MLNKDEYDLYRMLESNMNSYRERDFGSEANPYNESDRDDANDLIFATEVDTGNKDSDD